MPEALVPPVATAAALLKRAAEGHGLERVAAGVVRLRLFAHAVIGTVALLAWVFLRASDAVGALAVFEIIAIMLPPFLARVGIQHLFAALLLDAALSLGTWWLFGPVAGLGFIAFYVVAAGGLLLDRRRALIVGATALAAEGVEVALHFLGDSVDLPLFHDPGQLVTQTEILAGAALRAGVLVALTLFFMTIASMLRRAVQTLQATSQVYRDLYERAPTAYFSIGPSGTIRLVNETACEMLGYTREALIGMPVFDLYEPGADGRDRASQVFSRFVEGSEIRGQELRMRRKDGSCFWVSLSVGVERDESGAVIGSRSMVQDISHRKEAEEQTRALVKAKDDFVAAVSHELRTPLTSVIGFTSLLAAEDGGLTQSERREMIRSVSREATDLAHIVEDLLVVARTDVGTLRIKTVPVDLRAQTAQVLESLDQDGSRVVEAPDRSIRVLGDPSRVRQVLRNLLTNAQRYGGDRIGVRIGNGGPYGVVEVWDDGRGIRDEDSERVFEPYESAHDPGGLAASVGLGLAVSRRLATSMGGDLTYRREDGCSVFSLRLPLATSLLGAHGLPEAV